MTEKPTAFISEGDWKTPLGDGIHLQVADLLTVLGRGLRTLYRPVLEERIPEDLAPLIETLDRTEP